jgi:hypothetical protein
MNGINLQTVAAQLQQSQLILAQLPVGSAQYQQAAAQVQSLQSLLGQLGNGVVPTAGTAANTSAVVQQAYQQLQQSQLLLAQLQPGTAQYQQLATQIQSLQASITALSGGGGANQSVFAGQMPAGMYAQQPSTAGLQGTDSLAAMAQAAGVNINNVPTQTTMQTIGGIQVPSGARLTPLATQLLGEMGKELLLQNAMGNQQAAAGASELFQKVYGMDPSVINKQGTFFSAAANVMNPQMAQQAQWQQQQQLMQMQQVSAQLGIGGGYGGYQMPVGNVGMPTGYAQAGLGNLGGYSQAGLGNVGMPGGTNDAQMQYLLAQAGFGSGGLGASSSTAGMNPALLQALQQPQVQQPKQPSVVGTLLGQVGAPLLLKALMPDAFAKDEDGKPKNKNDYDQGVQLAGVLGTVIGSIF